MTKERHVVGASLAPEAKDKLDKAAERLGMKQQELLGRLIDWFGKQDDLVKLMMLGYGEPTETKDFLAFLLFREMQKTKPEASPVEVAEWQAAAVRAMAQYNSLLFASMVGDRGAEAAAMVEDAAVRNQTKTQPRRKASGGGRGG